MPYTNGTIIGSYTTADQARWVWEICVRSMKKKKERIVTTRHSHQLTTDVNPKV